MRGTPVALFLIAGTFLIVERPGRVHAQDTRCDATVIYNADAQKPASASLQFDIFEDQTDKKRAVKFEYTVAYSCKDGKKYDESAEKNQGRSSETLDFGEDHKTVMVDFIPSECAKPADFGKIEKVTVKNPDCNVTANTRGNQ